MRMLGCEIRKIAGSYQFLGLFLLLLGINALLVFLDTGSTRLSSATDYYPEDYRKVYADIASMKPEEANEFLEREIRKAGFILSLVLGEDVSSLLEAAGEEGAEFLEEYENQPYPRYTDHVYFEMQLLQIVKSEVGHCLNYQTYLDGIQSSARAMQMLAVMQGGQPEEGNYNYRNALVTAEYFKDFDTDGVKVGPVQGWDRLFQASYTDFLSLIFLLFVVMNLLTREKECQQLLITRTTTNGRWKLALTKLTACFVFCIVSVAAFYATSLFVNAGKYGLGDWGRRIQSLASHRSCPYAVSIAGYLALFLLAKLLVYFLVTALLYLIAVCCRSAAGLYGWLLTVLCVESLLYFYLPNSTTFFLWLKKINLLAFLKTDTILGAYQNLNFRSQPVSYRMLFFGSVLIFLLALSAASVLIFQKQSGVYSIPARKWKLRFRIPFGRHRSLVLHESYKILIQQKVLFYLLVYVVGIWFMYEPIVDRPGSAVDYYYRSYLKQYEGTYTQETQEKIDKENQMLSQERAEILAMSDTGSFSQAKLQQLSNKIEALDKVQARADYVKEKPQGALVYDAGYLCLIGEGSAENTDYRLALQMVLMLTLCLVGVYGIEYETGMTIPIRTSAKGRRQTQVVKFFLAFLVSVVLYLVTYGTYFYNVYQAYGLNQRNAPAYSIPQLEKFDMSILQYLLFVCVLRFVAMLLTIALIFFISMRLKRISVSIAVCTAIFVVPILLAMLHLPKLEYILLNPLWKGNLW